ncbi:hypothetical protein [Psychrobacillus sp. FSL H8-0510]|uniref:hypothetical protein n=1 Tax=Psychrobacillus sp. FSL H8-0510 TaxID=2921394 RepID=UPI0030F50851
MSNRRRGLELEEVVYTGEIIGGNVATSPKQDNELEKLQINNNHELNMKKVETVTDLVKVGSKIVDIISVREISKAKVSEMDAEIRRFKAETKREVATLKENRKTIVSKGEIVSDLLGKLATILMAKDVDVESKKIAAETFERIIKETIAENE